MKREDIKIDGKKILLSLFDKYKNESWVLSSSEIERKKTSFFAGIWRNYMLKNRKCTYGLQSGIVHSSIADLSFIYDSNVGSKDVWRLNLSMNELKDNFRLGSPNIIILPSSYSSKYNREFHLTEPEYNFFQEFLKEFSDEVDREFNRREEIKKVQDIKNIVSALLFKHSKTSILEEFDKDGNGIIDAVEGFDEFMSLFKKHQKIIIDLDKEYIQKFVKISNYLKTKRFNIQEVFTTINKTRNNVELENQVGFLKNQIHTYELLLFHSLNMITSIVEEDLIVFYEIYESFDKLNMFTSNWENEVSQKLSNIGDGLNDLMFSIDTMERNIVSGLNELSYVSQEGFSNLNRSVTRELQSIDSSIKFNNLLTGISTYQLYKINKQTKGLLK